MFIYGSGKNHRIAGDHNRTAEKQKRNKNQNGMYLQNAVHTVLVRERECPVGSVRNSDQIMWFRVRDMGSERGSILLLRIFLIYKTA